MKNNNSGMLDYFSTLVIGNDPDDQMSKYDFMEDTKVPYIIYEYSNIDKIRKERLSFYKELIATTNDKKIISSINSKIEELNDTSDVDYYTQLGELYSYDENKNIISTENPNGKWITSDKGGRIFSDYMKDFNDRGIFSTTKKDIDWTLTHMRTDKVGTYSRVWELCVEGDKAETDKDLKLLNNMRLFGPYFKNFKSKDEYVRNSCSFWTYAVVKDGEWVDMESRNEIDWTINFYDRFIKELPDNTLITIYECTK